MAPPPVEPVRYQILSRPKEASSATQTSKSNASKPKTALKTLEQVGTDSKYLRLL